MTTVQVVFTTCAIAVPAILIAVGYVVAAKDKLSNEKLLLGQTPEAGDEVASVKSSPWPRELPGLRQISSYDALKQELLDLLGDNLSEEARLQLRHTLMERCQAHVAWLLRLDTEQRSIERMVRRGMMSETDYQRFSRFAQSLDVEVNEVREEAEWLCNNMEQRSSQAAEIWRVAIQIWHQRRRGDELKMQEDAVRRKEVRSGLKGLKGGFFSGASVNNRKASNESPIPAEFKAVKWPQALPSFRSIQEYEALKAECLDNDVILAAGDTMQRLRKALKERCQQQVPWMLRLHQERQRVHGAMQRAQWQSEGTPTAEDLRNLEDFEKKCTAESVKVKEEANWLGERDGTPGLGNRIWSAAFEEHAKHNTQKAKDEKVRSENHERLIKAYAERSVRPWPSELPGLKQRSTYDQMKGAELRSSLSAQTAMLQGRSAPRIVGAQIACQLRSALMARCQQVIPLINRLEAEGPAFEEAAERGYVDDKSAVRFEAIKMEVKAEVEAVQIEAEWLSDHTQAGAGDEIWLAAFKIYAKRRAEVENQINTAQRKQGRAPTPCLLSAMDADAVN